VLVSPEWKRQPWTTQKKAVSLKRRRKPDQGERGPSVLKLLVISVVLAVIILAGVWVIFFRT
jgi:hypothetical protein